MGQESLCPPIEFQPTNNFGPLDGAFRLRQSPPLGIRLPVQVSCKVVARKGTGKKENRCTGAIYTRIWLNNSCNTFERHRSRFCYQRDRQENWILRRYEWYNANGTFNGLSYLYERKLPLRIADSFTTIALIAFSFQIKPLAGTLSAGITDAETFTGTTEVDVSRMA